MFKTLAPCALAAVERRAQPAMQSAALAGSFFWCVAAGVLLAQSCQCVLGRTCLLCPGISDVDLLSYREGVIDFDAEASSRNHKPFSSVVVGRSPSPILRPSHIAQRRRSEFSVCGLRRANRNCSVLGIRFAL
jgi:hypothetical protein